MPTSTEEVIAKESQRQASKRATRDKLRGKKPAEKVVKIYLPGEEEQVELVFRAISHHEYDKMQAKFPPTMDQRAQGESFNIDKFAPSLLSKVVTDPDMSVEDWAEIWTSDTWSRGECAQLFGEAVDICVRGMNIPFKEID